MKYHQGKKSTVIGKRWGLGDVCSTVLVVLEKKVKISHALWRKNSGTTAYKHSKNNKGKTNWITTAIWRVSARRKIPFKNSEYAKEQGNEDRNFTMINVGMF